MLGAFRDPAQGTKYLVIELSSIELFIVTIIDFGVIQVFSLTVNRRFPIEVSAPEQLRDKTIAAHNLGTSITLSRNNSHSYEYISSGSPLNSSTFDIFNHSF
jgi:hypothetical protein